MSIRDEAVEAMYELLVDYVGSTMPWERQNADAKERFTEDAQVALEAALPFLLAEKGEEIDRLREQGRRANANADSAVTYWKRIAEAHGDCICDLNPSTSNGPQGDCPQHGRTYSEWVQRGDEMQAERDALRAKVAAVEAAMRLGPECGHPLPESQEYGMGKCRRQAGHDPKHTTQPQHSRWTDEPDVDAILAVLTGVGPVSSP